MAFEPTTASVFVFSNFFDLKYFINKGLIKNIENNEKTQNIIIEINKELLIKIENEANNAPTEKHKKKKVPGVIISIDKNAKKAIIHQIYKDIKPPVVDL